MLQRKMLQAIAMFVTKFWVGILIGATLLSAFSIVCASRIGLDTDIMHLLPVNNRVANDFYEAAEVFDFNNNLIVVIEKDGMYSDMQVGKFMNEFALLLRKSDLIRKVDYKLPKISFDENARRVEDKFDVEYMLYQSPNKDAYLMFIFPITPSGDIEFSGKIIKEVKNIERQAKENNEEVSRLEINYTGGYAITLEESRNMERNY